MSWPNVFNLGNQFLGLERPYKLLCPRMFHSQGKRTIRTIRELLESLELFCYLLSVSGLLLFKSNPHHSTPWLYYASLWESSGSPAGPVKLLGQVLLSSTGTVVGPLHNAVVAETTKNCSVTVGMDWAIGRIAVGKMPSGELRQPGRTEQLHGSEGILLLSPEKLTNTFVRNLL